MLPKATPNWTLEEAAHLLNRAGFGGCPREVRRLHKLGRVKAVESFLSPKEGLLAFPPPEWAEREKMVESMKMEMAGRTEIRKAARGLSPEEADKLRREKRREVQRERRRESVEAQGWWFRRMLATKAPLREKMTLFWHDHFATSIRKVRQPGLMVRQNQLFRAHAFGSFRDLTRKLVVDPAMMIYLDTPGSKKGSPNENFAREVMELFTLGEGHYSEEDIREAARAFTGYRLNRVTGKVGHVARQWDGGEKTVFGKSGNFTGDEVVDLIFEKPRAARFMAGKIWAFFADEHASDGTLDDLAKTLRKADYRLKPMLRDLLLSREFYSERVMRTQIKSPVQFLVQMLKELEIEHPPTGFPLVAEQQLGQVLFMPPNVAGWDWGQAWINTNTLLTRYNLAGFLSKGSAEVAMGGAGAKKMKARTVVPGKTGRGWKGPDYERIAPRPLRENPGKLVDALVFRFFQGPVPDKARASFVEYAEAKKGVVFTDQEVAELCHLMMSTPYYQLC